MVWKKFNAFGAEVIISAEIPESQNSLIDLAMHQALDFEKKFSRFIKGNELFALNNLSGEELDASGDMVGLLEKCKRFYDETRGAFDPTVIGSLEKVGYDTSFELISGNSHIGGVMGVDSIAENFLGRPKLYELKMEGNKISAPKNFRIDFGGIGKGYIVDSINEKFFSDVRNLWISAGGDLLVKGDSPHHAGWTIEVQDPLLPDQDIFSIISPGGKLAVATSGVIKRKGVSGDMGWHHIIDPKTGLPVKNDILSVTVISDSVTAADVYAKTVLILGREGGLEFIEQTPDSECIIFFKNAPPALSSRAEKYIKK